VYLASAAGFACARAGLREPVKHRILVAHGNKVPRAEFPRLRLTVA
jgi:tRNA 2-selenouridine synthase SelU